MAYYEFREELLNDGFTILQFSVYARHTPSEENAVVHENRVKTFLPEDGKVRLLKITDKQFERMKVFDGKTRKTTERNARTTQFFLSCSGASPRNTKDYRAMIVPHKCLPTSHNTHCLSVNCERLKVREKPCR